VKWNAEKMRDQTGKVVIVTGSNTGIGFHMAEAFASKGATVILACRNMEKAEKAKNRILSKNPSAYLIPVQLDLANLSNVKQFSEKIQATQKRIDILINNAGVMIPPKSKTADGFELQIGTNHLGHFALTAHLLPLIENSEKPRIITLSSIVHNIGSIDFDDLNGEKKRYNKWRMYSQSKLANILFALELRRRLKERGSHIQSLCSHPGYSATDLQRHSLLWRFLNLFAAISAKKGAEPTLYAATEEEAISHPYWGTVGLFEARGRTGKARINAKAMNEVDAARLWEMSEELTKISYFV
tara:strand:- start:13600 stop:14496 length:897 start_codon:yes stop_codon:yes gene_type:complete